MYYRILDRIICCGMFLIQFLTFRINFQIIIYIKVKNKNKSKIKYTARAIKNSTSVTNAITGKIIKIVECWAKNTI